MSYDHIIGDTVDAGGMWLDNAGWFHFGITDVDMPAMDRHGNEMEGKICEVKCRVFAAEKKEDCDKLFSFRPIVPSPSHADGGKFAREFFDRFLYAIGLIGNKDLNKKISITADAMRGRQFIAKVMKKESKNTGKVFCEIAGKNMYHVDDPAMKGKPLSEEFLATLPASCRRIPGAPPQTGAVDMDDVDL